MQDVATGVGMAVNSKLDLKEPRVAVEADTAHDAVRRILSDAGASEAVTEDVAAHLVDTSLCGMESHGVMRVLQYAEQMRSGYMRASATPVLTDDGVDGGGGIGIPAMALAYREGIERARAGGIAALAVRNVAHTGRHGAFAEDAAEAGIMTICLGGGNRRTWRQVAPHGGAKPMLPTNPWCIGLPGGALGPVVLDFATSKIAGGWIYAARSAGALLPEGCLIDKDGQATRDPEAYFEGGAILPSGGHKGYGLALMGELVAEALLGPVRAEGNWLLIAIDTGRYGRGGALGEAAEDILSELRACPPAPGFDRVEIPGERERAHRAASGGIVHLPEQTWSQITALANREY